MGRVPSLRLPRPGPVGRRLVGVEFPPAHEATLIMRQQSITSLPLSPELERRNRMIKYSIAMGIRMICVVMLFFVQGWWLLICAVLAVTLPYFAVVIANVHSDPRRAPVVRPGAPELRDRPGGDEA